MFPMFSPSIDILATIRFQTFTAYLNFFTQKTLAQIDPALHCNRVKWSCLASSGKSSRSISEAQRQLGAPKKPWELRYALLSNTTPRWTQPLSMYLLERIGSSGKIWLVCRPALDPKQETEVIFQHPGEAEHVCFEHVDFSTLQAGDEFLLGQPAPMPGAILRHDGPNSSKTCEKENTHMNARVCIFEHFGAL